MLDDQCEEVRVLEEILGNQEWLTELNNCASTVKDDLSLEIEEGRMRNCENKNKVSRYKTYLPHYKTQRCFLHSSPIQ